VCVSVVGDICMALWYSKVALKGLNRLACTAWCVCVCVCASCSSWCVCVCVCVSCSSWHMSRCVCVSCSSWHESSTHVYVCVSCSSRHESGTYARSRRRSDLKCLDLQIIRFYRIIRGLPFSSVKICLKFRGLPWQTCLKVTGTPAKICWNFGSRTISSVCGICVCVM